MQRVTKCPVGTVMITRETVDKEPGEFIPVVPLEFWGGGTMPVASGRNQTWAPSMIGDR